MKKIFSIAVGLMILLSAGTVWAFDVSPQDVTGNPGSPVTVPINISNVGIGLDVDAFGFTLQYDKDVLTFGEVDRTGTFVENFSLVKAQETGPGEVKVSGAFFGDSVQINADGLFLKMKFIIKTTATKDSPLNIVDFKDDIQGSTTSSATVFVGPGNGFEISPANTQGCTGDTVSVPLNISNVGTTIDLDAFGFTFDFDESVLEFVGVDRTGTLVSSFTNLKGEEIGPGKVKVNGAYFGSSVKINADGLFLKIKFNVKNDKSSSLSLSDFKDDIGDALTNMAAFTPKTSCGGCTPSASDTDCDEMPDWWETLHFGTIDRDGTGNYDGDGCSDIEEYQAGTDPKVPGDCPIDDSILELPGITVCVENSPIFSVPLKLNNKENKGIEAIDVKVKFNPEVLVATDATLTDGILEGKNYKITYQVEDGEITISIFANGSLFAGNGDVAYLNFYPVGDEGSMTDLSFEKAKFNESAVDAKIGSVKFDDGCCGGYDILGTVNYYSNNTSVSNVLMELNGHESLSMTTEDDGDYSFSCLPEGNYTTNAYKNDHFGGLSGMDASRIAKAAAGLMTLDCYQKIAADVNQDGQITGVDASRVARYTAGKISYLNNDDLHWVFVPANSISNCGTWPPIAYSSTREYSPLNSDKPDQDFIAIRLGDVTGNWTDDPIRAKRGPHSVCEVKATQGSTLTIPIVLNRDTAIEGTDIKLKFDETVLELTGATLTGGILEKEDYFRISEAAHGEGTILIAGNGDLFTGSGKIVFVSFNVIGETESDAPVLSITSFECNEMPALGGFRVNGKVCQSIRLASDNDFEDVDPRK